MESILFLLMLAMIAGSAIVYFAGQMAPRGQAWAEQVCNLYNACDHIYWLFGATLVVIILYLISRRAQA